MTRTWIAAILLLLLCRPAFAETFTVSRVTVDNANTLSMEVQQLTQPYVGRALNVEDIVGLVNQITSLYQERGYLNSGATLPEQDLASGELRITVVEGSLGDVVVTDSGRISPAHVEAVVRSEAGGVLNIEKLQRAFSRLENERTIAAVKGQLVPGAMPGDAVLRMSVVEADAFSVTLAANNYRSPSVGSEQFEAELRHINVTGHSDEFRLAVNTSDGVDAGSVSYSFPIAALRSRFSVYYSKGETIVVEAPFDQINLQSETDTTGLRMSVGLIDELTRSLTLDVGIEKKDGETMLLGLPFDFSPGSVDGKSAAAVAVVGLQYQRRSRTSAFAAKVTYRKGLDALDATILAGTAPDGEFDLWQAQLSYVRRFELAGNDVVWSNRFNSQFTSDTLQAFERFALGGHDSIRGYRENQLLRDEAWEFRSQLEIPLYASKNKANSLVVYPFVDMGEGKNANFVPNTVDSVDLSSVGLGLRWLLGNFRFQLEWGERLTEETKQANELQDNGIHVGVSYEF